MDLSFAPFDRHREVTALPGDLAVLMVGVAARQAASPTARTQALAGSPTLSAGADEATAPLLAPATGTFCAATAASLAGWSEP